MSKVHSDYFALKNWNELQCLFVAALLEKFIYYLFDHRCLILPSGKQAIAFQKDTFAIPAPPNERQEEHLLHTAPLFGVPGIEATITKSLKLNYIQNLTVEYNLTTKHVVPYWWYFWIL